MQVVAKQIRWSNIMEHRHIVNGLCVPCTPYLLCTHRDFIEFLGSEPYPNNG